ncbi:hypothetical protein E0Z10_g10195 [Xylaria hypoxylon]|uniref:non-specific serine/threonine protein kinase n=1 Tax=Xylaria hypoxylon TaxID=37992 RepID=A0A4Z0Y6T8_9PEZI|nr:hypothetical protein E0Z10_g10195 [Xylaria hypoxylon]
MSDISLKDSHSAQEITSPQDTNPPKEINSHQVVDEGDDVYEPGGFHPVYIGDVYNSRYKILNKIGYGGYSTVWVIEDLQSQTNDQREFLALKVLRADCYGTEHDIFEREILSHLRDGSRNLLGYKYVTHLVDDFEHEGPNGKHVCLVFQLYGETLRSFGTWFDESMIPTAVMRIFTFQLLCALDFAHEHGVIHTDIQPSNIFVKFRDHSLIESVYLKEVPVPQQDRDEEHYTAIPSRPFRGCYFKHPAQLLEFEIALGDWGVSSWTSKHLTENIQPLTLRAPEVLIGAPWDASTDIWNLGALLLELYRAMRMFDGRVPPDGHYELSEHLAQIVDLFGPFPQTLMKKGNQEIVRDMFDKEGKVKGMLLPRTMPPLDSEVFVPGLDQDTREAFVTFLRAMMKIDPAERPSPEDLLRVPWLGILPPVD